MKRIWLLLVTIFGCQRWITWVYIVIVISRAYILGCVYSIVVCWSDAEVIDICVDHELDSWNLLLVMFILVNFPSLLHF